MSFCKEIGGYFAIESAQNDPFYPTAVAYNSGRSALRAIVRAGHIKRLAVPIYTCPVVWEVLREENCEILPYHISEDFFPLDVSAGAVLLYTNYFGICTRQVKTLANKYEQLIVDNAHAFYVPPCGWATIYSPRKFFGLPDGGLAFCQTSLPQSLPTDESFERCSHLLKRVDLGAEAGYADFKRNDESLRWAGLKKMSILTQRLIGNLPYTRAAQQRLVNFEFLKKALGSVNHLKIELTEEDVPMVYPFLTCNVSLREKLIQQKIFVATYWPGMEKLAPLSELELSLQKYLLPLPLDQRYTPQDLKRMVEVILNV